MITIGILATARRSNGGTLLYTLSMLDALSRLPEKDFRVVIFCDSGNREYDNYNFLRIDVPGPVGVGARRLLGKNVFRIADILLAPVYSTSLLVCGTPFAFTLHDLQERHYPGNFGLATRLWRRIVNRLLVSRARRVICESQFVKSDIVRFVGADANKIDVIPAPPTVMVSGKAGDSAFVEAVLRKFSIPAGFVFYPAQFWPHKNHLRLIEAFARLVERYPGYALVLTGRFNRYAERVFKRVRELGLEENVRHIGYVEQDELAALYRGSAVVVIPTLFESISIPAYEAFALGSAVCVSNVVALPEQVGDAGLLFDPESPEDISDKLCDLLANPELRADLVRKGRERIASINHVRYSTQLKELVEVMVHPVSRKTCSGTENQ